MSGSKAPSYEDLLGLIAEQSARIDELVRENEGLRAENRELRRRVDGGDPPAGVTAKKLPQWAKANRPKPAEKSERKPRGSAYTRPREEPTEIVEVAADCCPDCGRSLTGGEIVSSQQILEIPDVRYQVIEVRRVRRWCGVCGKRVAPPPTPPGLAPSEGCFGPRLMSLVATLVTVGRMSHASVRTLLQAQFGLVVAAGAISSMLHRVADAGKTTYEAWLTEIRQSPVVHADETGYREDGANGYLWVLATERTRLFRRAPGRAREVIEELLGPEFGSILVSDFYTVYTGLECPHQYCWVHLLRSARELREGHPEDKRLRRWVDRLKRFWEDAMALSARVRDGTESQRSRARQEAEKVLLKLANQAIARRGVASTLGDRIRRHSSELLTFVEHPDVPSQNNLAERAIRPAVIARKTSGGTRSDRGSRTKETLLTLFLTWALRGLNPLHQCYQLLAPDTPA